MWYWTKILFLILVGSILAWLAYELITFPSISRLKTENPTTTSMIEYRKSEAVSAGQEPKFKEIIRYLGPVVHIKFTVTNAVPVQNLLIRQ